MCLNQIVLIVWQFLNSSSCLSSVVCSELKDAGFNIQERGQIKVKGKGQMTTYFLLENLLLSEDSIMGKDCGHACIYEEDMHDQCNRGNKKKR